MTVERFVEPMTLGYTRDEIARFYDQSPALISERLAALRTEIRRSSARRSPSGSRFDCGTRVA